MDTMDRNYVEGHGVIRFKDLRLPASAVLGEVGQALRYAPAAARARQAHPLHEMAGSGRTRTINRN